MSSDSNKTTGAREMRRDEFAVEHGQLHANGRNGTPPGSHVEAQLRARVAELESQLTELAVCLEHAEHRAAELVALREREGELQQLVASYEHRIAVIRETRSWKLTAPLRSWNRYMSRLRGQ